MKKYVSALVLTALLLTGCGNTAGTATSSTPSADQSSEAVPVSAESEQISESQEAEASAEDTFYDLDGIDFPVPAGMEKYSKAEGKNLRSWVGGSDDAAVYYSLDVRINAEYQDEANGHTVAELPEIMLDRLDKHLYVALDSSTDGEIERKVVESQTEEEFMGVPALCEKGVITTYEDLKVNYIAHYAYLDFSEGNEMHTPTFWIAFTASDDKDALDLMNKAAEAPLTQAKLHATN